MQRTRRDRTRRATVAAVLAAAAALWAGVTAEPVDAAVGTNDYTVTTPSALWEAPPASAVAVAPPANVSSTRVTLPFTFTLFGEPYAETWVTSTGYLHFGQSANPGAQSSNMDFASISAGSSYKGIVAPLWDNLYHQGSGTLVQWTAGTAPNRRWIVTWNGFGEYNTPSARYFFQVKLFEGSNAIEFAYLPDVIPTTWTGASWSQGINAVTVGDVRYVCPVNANGFNTGHPPSDVRFVPRIVDYTGRVQFERLVPTAAGFGASPVPAWFGGARLDLRRGATFLASTYADADGNFAFHVPSGHLTQTGTVYALTETPACIVKDPAAAGAYETAVATNVSLQNSATLGTLTVTQAADAQAAWRAPANIARAVQEVWSWATTRTADAVPQLVVWYEPASAAPTTYQRQNGTVPTYMRIAGPLAPNPDLWDEPVIDRTFGRHVLASVAVPIPGQIQYDDGFDGATVEENAFAEGFGYWLWSAVTGGRQFVDASAAGAAVSRDLEDPQPATAKGPAVAAWVAAALCDLADPADEDHDWTDGTGAERDRPLVAAAAVTDVPRADLFYRSWAVAAGFPAGALSRNFVHHGLLADDAYEPNDAAPEPAPLGAVPVRPAGLVLNFGAEDWFAVTSGGSALGLVAEMSFNRAAYPADIQIQILGPAGQVLADKLDTGLSVVTASTGPVAAGTYAVRVRHARGEAVPSYSLQVTHRLEVPAQSLPSWTAGRPYSQPFAVAGGYPPYTFTITPPTGLPPGIAVNAVTLRASGTPSTPGSFDFGVGVDDAGVPMHHGATTHHVTVNAPLDLALGPFVAFAWNRGTDVTRQHTGGTAPVAFDVGPAGLAPGIAMDADRLRFHGTPDVLGSTHTHIAGVDVAGSAHEQDVTMVVCAALADAAPVAGLAEGDASCGFWADAVAGSRVVVSVAALKKQPKRAVAPTVLGPDGAAVEGATLKSGNGKASAAFVAPATGRYFVIVSSATGPLASMGAKVAITAPSKGSGSVDAFGPGDVALAQFGALAGATLAFKATPEKGAGVTANILALVRPDGTAVPLAGLASQKGATAILAAPLDQSGTWTVRVRGTGGTTGSMKFSYKLKQPKGVVYAAQ